MISHASEACMSGEPRVAFLARDLVWADKSGGSLPFSYAARKLQASLLSAPDLGDVETTLIDLRTDEIDAFFERIVAFRPTLVAASTYIWSIEVFSALAARLKAWDPSLPIVMGGPAARPSVLALQPYAAASRHVDALVTGEGEEVMREIVRHHRASDFTRRVAGLTVPGPLGWRRTTEAPRPELDAYASPYQVGNVPQREIGFLETFRGCPISCAFCQWGIEKSDRVHSVEYLTSHLEGLERAEVDKIYVLDAGFNLSSRAFRNVVEAERQVGLLSRCQVLGHIYPTFLKDEHLEFFAYFRQAEITVGVQSFDAAVLKRLGRPFDLERFERVLGELRGRFDIDLEIILGLPGDDPASFRATFERAIELATTVRVFYCLALPDALLERVEEFALEFDPRSFMLRSCKGWTREALAAEWEYVQAVASAHHRPSLGPNWVDFRTQFPGAAEIAERRGTAPLAPEIVDRLRASAAASASGFTLAGARRDGAQLLFDLEGAAAPLVLEVSRAVAGAPRFSELDGIAYSYRGGLVGDEAPRLHALIRGLHGALPPTQTLGEDG
jgi:radical SAM superfamily enzyme YgiQ (UPF0313 family)